jgi:hypothetical protein
MVAHTSLLSLLPHSAFTLVGTSKVATGQSQAIFLGQVHGAKIDPTSASGTMTAGKHSLLDTPRRAKHKHDNRCDREALLMRSRVSEGIRVVNTRQPRWLPTYGSRPGITSQRARRRDGAQGDVEQVLVAKLAPDISPIDSPTSQTLRYLAVQLVSHSLRTWSSQLKPSLPPLTQTKPSPPHDPTTPPPAPSTGRPRSTVTPPPARRPARPSRRALRTRGSGRGPRRCRGGRG